MLKLFDCSNEADELRANALKEAENKERIEEKLNATKNELSSVQKELDEVKTERDGIKTERDAVKKELEKFVNYPEKFAELKKEHDQMQQLMKTQNERSIPNVLNVNTNTTEIADQKKRISELEAQLVHNEMLLKDKDTIIAELTEAKVKLNDVERELRQTKSNDLCVEANTLNLEGELMEKKKELASTQKALEMMRAAKIDQDRLIIQQHVESSKQVLEITSLKKRNEELEAMIQQNQPDNEVVSALQREQEKVKIQQVEIEKLQDLRMVDSSDKVEMVKAKLAAEQELEVLRNELLALRNKVLDLTRVEQTSADMIASQEANAQRIVVLEKHIAEDAKDRTELQSVLAKKDNRIKQLEKQIAETDDALSSSSVTALTTKDQRIADLEKQLADAVKAKNRIDEFEKQLTVNNHNHRMELMKMESAKAIAEQKVLDLQRTQSQATILFEEEAALRQKIDKATIEDLRKQLGMISRRKDAVEEQLHQQTPPQSPQRQVQQLVSDSIPPAATHRNVPATSQGRPIPPPPPPVTPLTKREEPLDAQRLKNLQEINATLMAFSKDAALQADLQRPLVKVAMDLWKGKNPAEMSATDVDAAKFDVGVVRIYPRLKEFEQACSVAAVVFPIDHVETARTELSAEAVVAAFGPDFAAKYYIR